MAVSCEECAGAYQRLRLPLEVVRFERGQIESFLILPDPYDASLNQTLPRLRSRQKRWARFRGGWSASKVSSRKAAYAEIRRQNGLWSWAAGSNAELLRHVLERARDGKPVYANPLRMNWRRSIMYLFTVEQPHCFFDAKRDIL